MNYIKNSGDVGTVELVISKSMKYFEFYIWVQKPDIMSLNVIDPSGEEMGYFVPKIYSTYEKNFYLLNTNLKVTGYNPENFTGHQLFLLSFTDIKGGIWKINLRGEYITNGRFDIWLPDKTLLPEDTKFLNSNQDTTLTIPSTAKRVTTVAYYNSMNNSIVAASGKGWDSNEIINPDLTADGVNILTTSGDNDKIIPISGSSAATAIVAGAICLLIQWQINNLKDPGVYSVKLRSFLIYGARREENYEYPNKDIGYGKLDLLESFNVIGGGHRYKEKYIEYYINNLFIRYPLD